MTRLYFPQILCALLLISGAGFTQTAIPIETANFALVLQAEKDNYLTTAYCGDRLPEQAEYKNITGAYKFPYGNDGIYNNAYTPAGTWSLSEPAIQVTHADGNLSLDLKYLNHETSRPDDNTSMTIVHLQDPVYQLK